MNPMVEDALVRISTDVNKRTITTKARKRIKAAIGEIRRATFPVRVPEPEDRAELRALAEKTTPGPWWYDEMGAYVWKGVKDECNAMVADGAFYDENGNVGNVRIRGFGARLPMDENGTYIAAVSPDVVIGMLDEIAALRSKLRALVAQGKGET